MDKIKNRCKDCGQKIGFKKHICNKSSQFKKGHFVPKEWRDNLRKVKTGKSSCNKLNLNESEIKRLYLEEKLPATKIAKIMNCSFSVVYNRLKNMKIERIYLGKTKGKGKKEIDSKILIEYYLSGLSPNEIAQKLNCERTLIFRRLKELGVKIRTISESRKTLFLKGKLKSWNKGKKCPQISGKNNPFFGKHHSEETKNKIRENFFKSMKLGKYNIKPNKKEQFLDNIIQENLPKQYKLNVLGDTIINRKIPDWINCNGQKKAILFNGIYWHLLRFQKKEPNLSKEIQENRERKAYDEIGFKVCFVWEDELRHPEIVVEKIRNFNNI